MFFNLHSERRIAYKLLSSADLGTNDTSNQTHIGLYDDIFTFLQNREVEEQAMFIYNNTSSLVDCYFDRIENPDGTFRSPKIRKGEKNGVSVVTLIRDIVKTFPLNYRWYLVWFGLESEDLVFYLFHDHSEDYNQLSAIIDLSRSGRISSDGGNFNSILTYLEKVVNAFGTNILKELEIASQIGTSKKYKTFDLEKANQIFKDIGIRGERLVAEYLDWKKYKGLIFNYTWYNKSMESGLPYDFTIQENNQTVNYVDAKSTSFGFEQPMVFSNQEIEFISGTNSYNLFRVYDLAENHIPHLRINSENVVFANSVLPYIKQLRHSVNGHNIGLQSVKLTVPPTIDTFNFKSEIKLLDNKK